MTDNIRALLEQALEKLLECWPKSDPCINGIRAELAKPVEPVEPFGYWHEAEDPDESEFHLHRDIPANDCKLCKPLYLHPPTPAWHDAPTCAGWWVFMHPVADRIHCDAVLITGAIDKITVEREKRCWYGPIPQDAKAEGGAA